MSGFFDVTLNNPANMGSSKTLIGEISDTEFQKIENCEIGDDVDFEIKIKRGHTGNSGQVYIQKNYEQILAGGIEMNDVQVKEIEGPAGIWKPASDDLYPENTKVKVKATKHHL